MAPFFLCGWLRWLLLLFVFAGGVGRGLCAGARAGEGRFVEDPKTGSLVAEVESATPVSDWKLETEHAGFSGAGYFAWRGPHVKKQPGTAVLRYAFDVRRAGTYALSIRARRDQDGTPRANDQVNDVFVRLNGAGKWTKVSHKTRWGEWGWMRKFSYAYGLEDARYELAAGAHVLEIAARSDNVKIDLLRLEHVSSATMPPPPSTPNP